MQFVYVIVVVSTCDGPLLHGKISMECPLDQMELSASFF